MLLCGEKITHVDVLEILRRQRLLWMTLIMNDIKGVKENYKSVLICDIRGEKNPW